MKDNFDEYIDRTVAKNIAKNSEKNTSYCDALINMTSLYELAINSNIDKIDIRSERED